MNVNISFEIEDNTQAVLANIAEKKRSALRKIGLFVEGEAKLNAPVDTGILRGSIRSNVSDEKVIIGTDIDYALFVEKGTSRQTAQPFLTPAVEGNIGEIKRIVESEFRTL